MAKNYKVNLDYFEVKLLLELLDKEDNIIEEMRDTNAAFHRCRRVNQIIGKLQDRIQEDE